MKVKSEALVVVAPQKLEVCSIDVPEPKDRQVLVAVAHSCISPGTESRVLSGRQVNMPAFPVVPGYSAAGIIESTGPDSCWAVGQKVFFTGAPCSNFAVCWGAHQRHVLVEDGSLVEVPHSVDLCEASSAKLVSIALHGIRLADVVKGERVAVLGLGPIGMFAALCSRARRAEVVVADLRKPRQHLASEIGFAVMDPAAAKSRGAFDVVVDATGSAGALAASVGLLRNKPWDDSLSRATRLVIQGSYGSPPALPYDELFLKEPQILIPRDNQPRDVKEVLEMMSRGEIRMTKFLQDFGSPGNAHEAYSRLQSGEGVTGFFTW